MTRCLILAAIIISVLSAASPSKSIAQEKPKAYPITLAADDVHEIAKLSMESNGLKITAKDVLVVPIRCEVGVTGAMVIGAGEFSYVGADAGDEAIKGEFRAAMLRFDPADQTELLPLDKANKITDQAVYEMSRHLLDNVFRHCWHSGKDALIPDKGSLVASVYSKTHGDLLLSTGPRGTAVHNFTTGKSLLSDK